MWQFIKDFHSYRPDEKRAIVLLLSLIVLTIGATVVFERMRHAGETAVDTPALQAFADSIRRQDSLKVSRHSRHYTQARQVEKVLRPFDPNTADSVTLRKLGLPYWMAGNVLKYRARGGRFREAADFRKIYGMSDELFEELKPYIEIHQPADRPLADEAQPVKPDSVHSLLSDTLPRHEVIEKYQPGTLVDLNKADTTELKKIPGIGSGIARMIVNYRNQLGGFYQVAQLREINLDAARLNAWFSIDEADIRRIPVNKSSVDRLRRHPYIDFYQAKAMVEHRRKHGDLKSMKPLVLYEEFTEHDLERIGHYLSFE